MMSADFICTLLNFIAYSARTDPARARPKIGAGVFMKTMVFILILSAVAWAQTTEDQQSQPTTSEKKADRKKGHSAAGDIGGGTADVGKGAAKGAGNLAKGTAKGAVDVATLHPIDGAAAIGGGAASAGKNVAVGTAKGTGRVARGVGHVLKKIF
jgi:hypothetical protein